MCIVIWHKIATERSKAGRASGHLVSTMKCHGSPMAQAGDDGPVCADASINVGAFTIRLFIGQWNSN